MTTVFPDRRTKTTILDIRLTFPQPTDMTMLLCILASVVHFIILATNNVKQLNTLLFTSFKNIFSGITQTFNQ